MEGKVGGEGREIKQKQKEEEEVLVIKSKIQTQSSKSESCCSAVAWFPGAAVPSLYILADQPASQPTIYANLAFLRKEWGFSST